MAFIGNFNAADVEPADFSALPSGEYITLISSSGFRNTKNGDGQYLVLAFQIIDGPKKGRMIWHNLNLINSNAKAVEIAQRELSAICRACGVMQIDNSDLLHDKPMKITVEYIPPKPDGKGGEWPEKNRIKKWAPMNGAMPVVATTPPAATAARQTTSRPAAPPKAPPPPSAAVNGKPWGPKTPEPVVEMEPELEDIPF